MIKIRAAKPADANQIAAIYAPYVAASAVSFETDPPNAQSMRGRMAKAADRYPWLVATSEDSDVVLGYAYANSFRDRPAYHWTVETSIYVAGDLQRQGVGRLLYSALIATLRAQDYVQAIAALAMPNEHTISLHESLGFRRAGMFREVGYKHGQWRDIGFWQLELTDSASPPPNPKPFSEVGVVGPY